MTGKEPIFFMKKKLTALLLLVVLLLQTVGCAEGEKAPEETTESVVSAEAQTGAEPEPEKKLTELEKRKMIADDLPEVTYDGKAFRVLTSSSSYSDYMSEIAVEELNGDACNDAVYERNLRVEERFNTKIEAYTHSDPHNQAQVLAQSGSADYDVLAFFNYLAYNPIMAEALLNWYDAPHQDFDKPWHIKLANDGATINNRLYAICSDFSYTSMTLTYAFFANLEMAANYGYPAEDLYTLVQEGKWTIDKFIDIVSGIYEDTNGDGQRDKGDIYGYGYSIWNPADVWFTAFGETITVKNEEGRLDINFMTDKTVSMLDKLLSCHYDFPAFNQYDGGFEEEDIFVAQKLVFSPLRFQAAYTKLRDMSAAYTMLPYPKWDEAQSGYYTNADDKFTVFGLPVTAHDDLEFISCIFEAMSAESYKTVFPAYYDKALKGKYSTDATTAQMVDMIMAGRNFDFTFQFGESLFQRIPYMIRDHLQKNDPNIASAYKKVEKPLNISLTKKLYKLYGIED